jgi:hypothetical protein
MKRNALPALLILGGLLAGGCGDTAPPRETNAGDPPGRQSPPAKDPRGTPADPAIPRLARRAGGGGPREGDPQAVTTLRVPHRGIQPQAVMDRGVLHLIYFTGPAGHGDISYVRSTDGGKTFSEPLRVNSHPGSAVAMGNIRGAHLAVGKGGRVHVAWMGSGEAKPRAPGGATPMLYTRLDDAGKAFEPQRNVIRSAVGLDGGGSVAADPEGNVYVAWHAPAPGAEGEEARRVWVARSTDEGKTFAPEQPAWKEPTGACGCCGMRAFADHAGHAYLLYRSATEGVNRDMYLLTSGPGGAGFRGERLQGWKVNACPMSSAAFAEGKGEVLAAWQTRDQVYFARIDPKTGKPSPPVAAPGKARRRKHPAVAVNARGETILAWTEGMAWNRGGSVAWQVFDTEGKPTGAKGRADGVPTWSLVAVFARPDGGFTVIY